MSSYLDLRDLAKELEDLEGRNNEPIEEVAEAALEEVGEETLDEDERERLAMLQALDRELNGLDRYSRDEPTAIPEDEFERYAQELADDIGAIDRNAKWPLNHIDWEAAAEELKHDYTSFDFDGESYLIRSI